MDVRWGFHLGYGFSLLWVGHDSTILNDVPQEGHSGGGKDAFLRFAVELRNSQCL